MVAATLSGIVPLQLIKDQPEIKKDEHAIIQALLPNRGRPRTQKEIPIDKR